MVELGGGRPFHAHFPTPTPSSFCHPTYQGVVVDDVDVDGEMSVDALHLVLVSLSHTSEHVLNVRADRPHTCNGLPGGEDDLQVRN